MKNLRFFSLLAILAFIVSCGQEPREMLVGEWKISDISSSAEIADELKEAHQESINEMKETYLLVIKADSTFEHSVSETTSNGKWKLSEDAKTLTLTYDHGLVENSKIIELSANKLVTSVEFNNAENTVTFEKGTK